MLKTDQSIV